MPLEPMYDLVAGSPEAGLVNPITSSQLAFDITAAPDLVCPMLITICDRQHFETMLATNYTAPTVTVAARARAGTARPWIAASVVVIGGWTKEHYDSLRAHLAQAAWGTLYLYGSVGGSL
jgi:hypothetical protein